MNDNVVSDGRWNAFKEHLISTNRLDPFFGNIDIVQWTSRKQTAHNPLLLSEHTRRIAELTERCLTLRREIRELEILAVKAATEYALFSVTSEMDERMELLRLYRDARDSEAAGYAAASTAFGSEAGLQKGLALGAATRAKALVGEVKTADELKGLIAARWKSVRDHQDAYHLRTQEKGNAHNYGERAKSLTNVLDVCVQEITGRSLALREGLQVIYGWQATPLPSGSVLAQLDDLVVWTLQVQHGLAQRAQYEGTFDVVVPLVQPWLEGGRSLMRAADFEAAVKDASGKQITLSFEIDPTVFFGARVRLKAFGLSFGNVFNLVPSSGIDSAQTADGFVRLAARVQAPEQLRTSGDTYQPVPILLGSVSLHQAGQPTGVYEGPLVENVDPVGKWTINLHPRMVWKDEKERLLGAGVLGQRIRDLKLLFRVYSPSQNIQ